MSDRKNSLDTFDELMRQAPDPGGNAGAGRPELPKTDRQSKAEATTEAARTLIDAASEARAAKTERLKAEREARDALGNAAE